MVPSLHGVPEDTDRAEGPSPPRSEPMKMQTTARTAGLLTFLILALAFSTDGWAQCGRGGDRTARPQLPTVDEMAAAIDADASQRAALAEARLAWSENR